MEKYEGENNADDELLGNDNSDNLITTGANKAKDELAKKASNEMKKKVTKEASKKVAEGVAKKSLFAAAAPILFWVAVVVIIIIITVGIATFLMTMPGMLMDSIHDAAKSWVDKFISYLGVDETTLIREEDINPILDSLENMGYDIKGYGFLTDYAHGNDLSTSSSSYLDTDTGVVRYSEDTDEHSADSIKKAYSDFMFAYLVSDNYMYTIKNFNLDTQGGNHWYDKVFAVGLGYYARLADLFTNGYFSERWGNGMIAIYHENGFGVKGLFYRNTLANNIKLDPEQKVMTIKKGFFGKEVKYNLDGWTGRYGIPLEFLVSVHMGTMMPDLAYSIATSFPTEIVMLLHPTDDGETYIPYISAVENHWYRDVYFVKEDKPFIQVDEDYEEVMHERWTLYETFDSGELNGEYKLYAVNSSGNYATSTAEIRNYSDASDKFKQDNGIYLFEGTIDEAKELNLDVTKKAITDEYTSEMYENIKWNNDNSNNKWTAYEVNGDSIKQTGEGMRGETNPVIKELFLYDTFFRYDGSQDTAEAITQLRKDNDLDYGPLDLKYDLSENDDILENVKTVIEAEDGSKKTYSLKDVSGKNVFNQNSLNAFSMLENTHTIDADYIYRDFKELAVELGYFKKEELTDETPRLLAWPVPDTGSHGYPYRKIDKRENEFGSMLHSKGDILVDKRKIYLELLEGIEESTRRGETSTDIIPTDTGRIEFNEDNSNDILPSNPDGGGGGSSTPPSDTPPSNPEEENTDTPPSDTPPSNPEEGGENTDIPPENPEEDDTRGGTNQNEMATDENAENSNTTQNTTSPSAKLIKPLNMIQKVATSTQGKKKLLSAEEGGGEKDPSEVTVEEFLEAADKVHKDLEDNGFTYSQGGGNQTNYESALNSGRYVDCSAYVSWVLQEVGIMSKSEKQYTGDPGSRAGGLSGKFAEYLITREESGGLQPGDIPISASHVQINGEEQDGGWMQYNAGSTNAIQSRPYAYNPDFYTHIIRFSMGHGKKADEYKGYEGNEAVVSPVTGILLEYGTYGDSEAEKDERMNLDMKYGTFLSADSLNTNSGKEIIDKVGYAKIMVLDAENYRKLEAKTGSYWAGDSLVNTNNTSNTAKKLLDDPSLKSKDDLDDGKWNNLNKTVYGYKEFVEKYEIGNIAGNIVYIDGFICQDVDEELGDVESDIPSGEPIDIDKFKVTDVDDEESLRPSLYELEKPSKFIKEDFNERVKAENQIKADAASSIAINDNGKNLIFIKEGTVLGRTMTDKELLEADYLRGGSMGSYESIRKGSSEDGEDIVIGNYLRMIFRNSGNDSVIENVEEYIKLDDLQSSGLEIDQLSNDKSIPEKVKVIMDYLMTEQGFTKEAAAGLVGNLMLESGLKGDADNTTHYGICQWDYTGDPTSSPSSGRWQRIFNYLQENGFEYDHVGGQVKAIFESEDYDANKDAVDGMKGQTDAREAAKYWDDTYERSGGQALEKRQDYAEQAIEIYDGTRDSFG